MYDLDHPDSEGRYPLLTHENLYASIPLRTSSAPDAARTTSDVELSTRELMWALMVLGVLTPIIGVFADGFLGFLIGALLGIALGVCATITRVVRIRAIGRGRSDLAFSSTETKVETILGALVATFAVASIASHLRHRHVRLLAQEIAKVRA